MTSVVEQALSTCRRGEFTFTPTGLVQHSNAGSQYTAIAFSKESELIDVDRSRSWTGRAAVERETAAWVHWYNTDRLNSSIGYTVPIEHEERYRQNVPSTSEVA